MWQRVRQRFGRRRRWCGGHCRRLQFSYRLAGTGTHRLEGRPDLRYCRRVDRPDGRSRSGNEERRSGSRFRRYRASGRRRSRRIVSEWFSGARPSFKRTFQAGKSFASRNVAQFKAGQTEAYAASRRRSVRLARPPIGPLRPTYFVRRRCNTPSKLINRQHQDVKRAPRETAFTLFFQER